MNLSVYWQIRFIIRPIYLSIHVLIYSRVNSETEQSHLRNER